MEKHHCHVVNRDAVKFTVLSSEGSLTPSDCFYTNYWKKWRCLLQWNKGSFPFTENELWWNIFCGRNYYYLIYSSWQTWKIRNLHDIVKDEWDEKCVDSDNILQWRKVRKLIFLRSWNIKNKEVTWTVAYSGLHIILLCHAQRCIFFINAQSIC